MGHAQFLTQSLNIYVYRHTWGVDSYVHGNKNLYRILYVMYRIALSHAHHVCHEVTTHHGNGRGHSGHEVYCGRKLVENSDHVPIFARITGHPVGVSVSLHSPQGHHPDKRHADVEERETEGLAQYLSAFTITQLLASELVVLT